MRKTLTSEQRQERIIRAVTTLAASRGPQAVTTAAIAAEMGVTQGAVFRCFASKDHIWRAVLGWTEQTLLARLDAAAAGLAPLPALEAMFLAHADFIVENPGVPRILFAELQRPDATPARDVARRLVEAYAARIVGTIAAAQTSGVIARDVAPRTAATLFIGAMQGLMMQSLIRGDAAGLRATARDVFAVYARALTPAPRSSFSVTGSVPCHLP